MGHVLDPEGEKSEASRPKMMCLLLMVICHFTMVMGMGPDTSTEAVEALHQQAKPGRDRALDSKYLSLIHISEPTRH
eukprot:4131873-Karenia_brevis.AAC.1